MSPQLMAQFAVTIVRTDSLKPGDVFPFTIVVKKNQTYDKLILPDSASFGEDFEIRAIRQFKPGIYTDSVVYELQYFGVGEKQIPELPIRLVKGEDTLTITTDVIPMLYKRLTSEQASADSLKPLKPIFLFASNWWVYLILLGILILITYLLIKKYWPKTEEKPVEEVKDIPAFVDPFKEYDLKVDAIRTSDNLKTADYKAFYTELTDAVRFYMERVYQENALEMTTSEIRYALLRKRIDTNLQNMILMLLNQADRVKFAKYTPIMESALNDIDLAVDLGKQFRMLDKQRVNKLKEEYEIQNGLRKNIHSDGSTAQFDNQKEVKP